MSLKNDNHDEFMRLASEARAFFDSDEKKYSINDLLRLISYEMRDDKYTLYDKEQKCMTGANLLNMLIAFISPLPKRGIREFYDLICNQSFIENGVKYEKSSS